MNMLIVLYLVMALIVLLIIYDRVKYRRIYKMLGKFPGPISPPLIGVAYNFRSNDVIIGSVLKYLRTYGPTFTGWVFRVPIVVVSDPKHLKIVLTSDHCLDKEKRYLLFQDFLGNGLLVAPAKIWKQKRKLMNPTMNQKILDSFFDIFVKHSHRMIEYMEKHIPEKKLFDIDHFAMEYFLDTVIETVMGINDEMPRPPRLLANLDRMAEILVQRAFKVWLQADFIFRLSPLGREFQRLRSNYEAYIQKIIDKRHNQFLNQDKDDLSFNENKKKPFLEHLISIENKFTIKELKDEVVVFLAAAIDTSSISIGYLLVCLGVHKDIQEKVVEELLDVFGESDRPICFEDLPKLQYLERTIKESLRLFSTIPFVARDVVEDIDIEDYVIPKGTSLVVAIAGVHRNEKFWPDPLKFDPDRFLPSEIAKRHPYSYLPFSGGGRNCIGKSYAMMNLKITASYILRKFKIDTNIKLENIQSTVQIMARIIGGANISIEKRHKV